MKRRTMAVVLVGTLLAATAAMAIPVTPDPARTSAAGSIHIGWQRTERSNGMIEQALWAVRDRCAADTLGERLLCAAIGVLTRAAGRTFEGKLSDDMGLPLPGSWALVTAKNSPTIRFAHVETPLDLATVLGFYRGDLENRGWAENDGAVVAPDRAVIAFTTADGPALLRLTRQDGRTIADLSLRKRAAAAAPLLPKPGQAWLMIGNGTDEAADLTVNDQIIRLAARSGATLVSSENAAGELPDDQKLDLPPGKYKVAVKVKAGTARNGEFEVAANETWGLLVGTDGVLLPIRLY